MQGLQRVKGETQLCSNDVFNLQELDQEPKKTSYYYRIYWFASKKNKNMKLFHGFGWSIAACLILRRSEVDEINFLIVSVLSMSMDSTGTPECSKQIDSFKIK